jgi:hypothetical protein
VLKNGRARKCLFTTRQSLKVIIFERRLVRIKKIGNACRGTVAASQLLDGHTPTESFKGDRFLGFGVSFKSLLGLEAAKKELYDNVRLLIINLGKGEYIALL